MPDSYPDWQTKRKKSSVTTTIIIVLGCALLLILGAFLTALLTREKDQAEADEGVPSYSSKAEIDPGATDYTGEQSNPQKDKANPSARQTQIPGYGSIKIDSETKKLNVALHNPAGNPCFFVIHLIVEGQEIYKTKMIPPGQAIYNAVIETSLGKGSYEAVLQYECFHVDSLAPLNGADVNVILNIE